MLIQKNEGGSSLFANSGGNSMFNARGTSNILTKATWVLASIFLVNCVLMATIASSQMKNAGTIVVTETEQTQPAEPADNKENSAEEPVQKQGDAE